MNVRFELQNTIQAKPIEMKDHSQRIHKGKLLTKVTKGEHFGGGHIIGQISTF